ncbi:hypothetical protein SOHN41_02265 [Shewanella sp. HN-41]|nr:hypothetical protein SOHN41_02265 [Shewanella sp. HN-41]
MKFSLFVTQFAKNNAQCLLKWGCKLAFQGQGIKRVVNGEK